MPTSDETVSVIGLGLMGSALAKALVAKGYEVTVWNRSPEKSAEFAGLARVASSILDAFTASGVIVVCLLNYEAGDSLMRSPEIESVLSGKVLIQLSTGSPAEARRTSAWAQACRAGYLDGAILGSPSMVGDQAKVLVSGPRGVFDRYIDLFEALTREPTFCGDEVGRAAALDHAALELSAGSAMVLFHAMALCAAESIPFEYLFGLATPFKEGYVERVTNGIATDDVPSGTASIHTWAAWAETLVRVADDAGVSTSLPRALLEGLSRTIELGQGDKDFPAVYEAFRPSPRMAQLS
jgi:3-hydroxyisobutyrate dehydrogenase-like beta-hydroxyacid dehydrogenase